MTRGEAPLNKVHYQGEQGEDFLVFVDDIPEFNKWKGDKSVALASFMGNFKVYITHKQGAEGTYDSASNSTLENEFNTTKEEEVIKIILEKGTLQATRGDARSGDRNMNSGPRVAH